MSGRRPHRPLYAPLLAAVLMSAAAHAAVVMMAASREPVGLASEPAKTTMRARLAPAPIRSAMAEPAPPTPVVPSAPSSDRSSNPTPARPVERRPAVPSGPSPEATTDAVTDRRPTPLTYPVISLPSDDDPRRVGLVRMMLIVSSEGRVVKTVVTAATLSQDYIDRITESFEAVRFEPATVQGLPRASWYEVVVDFTFDPDAHPST